MTEHDEKTRCMHANETCDEVFCMIDQQTQVFCALFFIHTSFAMRCAPPTEVDYYQTTDRTGRLEEPPIPVSPLWGKSSQD
jgi:hypothetical protein